MILVKRCISPTQITGLGKNLRFVLYESTPLFNGFSCPEKWMKLQLFCSLLQGRLPVWIWGVFPSSFVSRSDGEVLVPVWSEEEPAVGRDCLQTQIPNPRSQISAVSGPATGSPADPSFCPQLLPLSIQKKGRKRIKKVLIMGRGSIQTTGMWGHPFSTLTAGVAAAAPFSWWTGALLL